MRGLLERVEGISLSGLPANTYDLEALGRMPQLRVLILDGVKMASMPSGLQLKHLAMLSWRDAGGPELPFVLETMRSVAVLDISESVEGGQVLERLSDDFQARRRIPDTMDADAQQAHNVVVLALGLDIAFCLSCSGSVQCV